MYLWGTSERSTQAQVANQVAYISIPASTTSACTLRASSCSSSRQN